MPNPAETIAFEHKGIGTVLAHRRLAVPLNQREYAWEREHVSDLLDDFANAIATNKGSYFLGTIVLTRGKDVPEVSDGQQRLATTTVLLAAIRDYFFNAGNEKRAASIEQEFLFTTDLRTEETLPRLRLNVDDNEFFTKLVLARPNSEERQAISATKDSHRRIAAAVELAEKRIQEILAPYNESARAPRLFEWVEFIRDGAQVILLTVPDHLNAFVMFETLNDRGLRASQADLLKNYLLSHSGDRLSEAQQKWAEMLGTLEAVGIDDITVVYLRHLLVSLYGPTLAREVYDRVRANVNSQQRAIEFLDMLAGAAQDYVALLNPEHRKWNEYGTTTRKHLGTILSLRIEQIRPLMFAVARRFETTEIKKAFRLFVSWSVRFLVAGGHRGGVLDKAYSLRAWEVGTGKIGTTAELATAMRDTVPHDAAFEAAFGEARVSQAYLARYYLRALEQKVRNESHPELEPSNEETILNLEHILPVNPEDNWPEVAPEIAAAHYRRIGNMVLLNAKQNSAMGNVSFEVKKSSFADSTLVLTRDVAGYASWGVPEITDRQRKLASLAVQTWPISAG